VEDNTSRMGAVMTQRWNRRRMLGAANAGAFGPNTLDGTFGPAAVFVHSPPRANASPLEGFQHFGEVDIDRHSRAMTVRLRDLEGTVLWSTTLPAA
jgi:alkaline phosphatase D